MPTSAGVDMLLDRLIATTEELRDSARAFSATQASGLLARRQQLTSSLQSTLQTTNLTKEQRLKLEQVTRLGEQTREAFLIKRETTRKELQETLSGRRLNESFKPYRPKKLGRLNIKL